MSSSINITFLIFYINFYMFRFWTMNAFVSQWREKLEISQSQSKACPRLFQNFGVILFNNTVVFTVMKHKALLTWRAQF